NHAIELIVELPHQGVACRARKHRVDAVGVADLLLRNQLAADREALLGDLFGAFQPFDLVGIVADLLFQLGKSRGDPLLSLAKLIIEVRLAVEAISARRAFGAEDQQADIRKLVHHLECVRNPGGIRPRLDVEADRGRADDEEYRKPNSETDTLRQHRNVLTFRATSQTLNGKPASIGRTSESRRGSISETSNADDKWRTAPTVAGFPHPTPARGNIVHGIQHMGRSANAFPCKRATQTAASPFAIRWLDRT